MSTISSNQQPKKCAARKKIAAFLFICALGLAVSAQKITISGYVKDVVSKEALIGATVVNANDKSGTTTNQYGFFH